MNDVAGFIGHEPGPSWARKGWPLTELDDINLGLDPTQATIESFKKASRDTATATGSDPEAVRRAAEDSIQAMMLIRTYRVRGHLAAKLDPLGLHHSEIPADLTPAYHGFSDADLDRQVWIGGALGLERATIREIVEVLRANYCGTIGVEYMHI
ncbi:MAG TPA: 2-oxoglutarate dehydrogenase E1 component, partial [Sphingomicrobium sp.]|nr:2-oxoglutarate dehydrogenase E1 component [Sphingomicrobium sp.]